jgi:hypothetical protein
MTKSEDFESLYEFLKLWSNPKKHWSDKVSWEIAKYIQIEVLKASKFAIQNSNFIFFT